MEPDDTTLQFDNDGIPRIDEYCTNYGVSHENMKYAKPDAIVMHPGPMNRGIEIEGTLVDGRRLVVINQVTKGIAFRMAVLNRIGKMMSAC
jgi:aspartate carbamoyltransferase catalytic subunit|tara:strand:- start:6 stop:278 length:273 start_codon:yes stop_codon:yes gene_type:complete